MKILIEKVYSILNIVTMKIVPSILTSDIDSFWDQINKLSSFFDHFHIDILDGTNYGNSKTISIEDIFNTSSEHKELIKKIALDIHFMIKNPNYLYKNVITLKSVLNINCLY